MSPIPRKTQDPVTLKNYPDEFLVFVAGGRPKASVQFVASSWLQPALISGSRVRKARPVRSRWLVIYVQAIGALTGPDNNALAGKVSVDEWQLCRWKGGLSLPLRADTPRHYNSG